MQINLQEDATTTGSKTWDVAVFGSGPAGITVARKVAAGGKSVLLCEAGELEYSEASQAAYAGTESGVQTHNMALKVSRLRYFGGTSNHWTGMCGLFQASDFRPTRHHGLSGWPIEIKEVHAHLGEASAILDLPTTDLAPRPLAGSDSLQRATVTFSPPTRFGTKYRAELFSSPRVDVALDATLVELRLDGPSRAGLPVVGHAVVKDSRHREVRIRAREFVLALGAVENARILLNSRKQVPNGLGNEADFVGRCFMEHLNVEIGRFVANSPTFFSKDGTLLSPTESLMRSQRVGNAILAMHANAEPTEYGRLAPLRRATRDLACKFETVREFARRFKDFNCAGDGIISSMLEQSPNRDSRITLGKDVDAYGVPRSHLHWVLDESDRRTIRVLGLELAKTMVRINVARVRVADFISDPSAEIKTWFHAHQMGTTRMSSSTRDGVVNSDSRVHSIGNLYIAGSSVFPTGGGVNPTLTLVMLALRLGSYLRTK